MVKTEKKARLQKKNGKKSFLVQFVESDYTNFDAFKSLCKDDENLMIYTCLEKNELTDIIKKLKEIPTIEDKLDYLINNQPYMNETEQRYNKCVESITMYLKGYIEYNGWKMANASGDAEDWTNEFWLKFTRLCDFYRVRWFHRDRLSKESKVTYEPKLYKEFIYICRFSITGERKHLGFLATQNKDASLFKTSLDEGLDIDGEKKSLADVIKDPVVDADTIISNVSTSGIIDKALYLVSQYDEAKMYYDKIKNFYETQELEGVDKKTVTLGKIFLYKAGLVSPNVVKFMKNLSSTYKAKYNISVARLRKLSNDFNKQKIHKSHKPVKREKTWHEIVLEH